MYKVIIVRHTKDSKKNWEIPECIYDSMNKMKEDAHMRTKLPILLQTYGKKVMADKSEIFISAKEKIFTDDDIQKISLQVNQYNSTDSRKLIQYEVVGEQKLPTRYINKDSFLDEGTQD